MYEDVSAELKKCQLDSDKAAKLLMRRDIALTEANHLLKQTNKAKSEFISLAAHQLRTPVATINWYSGSLLNGKESKGFAKQQINKLLQIHTSSQHMAELIDTFLLMSRLELGTEGENRKDINFNTLMNGLDQELGILISEKKITYTKDIDVQEVICADRNMVVAILQNLISNAIKYTPDKGSVSVEIKIKQEGEKFGGRNIKRKSLTIEVEDNGFGIPKTQQSRIFERLFRADNVVNKDINGTGLGLYIVQLMIRQLGGDIWFVSEEGEGTIFHVAIPVHMISSC